MFKRYKTAACSRSSLSICYAILLVLSVLCFPKTNPNIQRFRTLLSFCLGISYNKFYEWRLSQLYTQLLQKPEKHSGLYWIRTLDICDTGTALYELSKQANWEQVVELVRYKPVKGWRWTYEYKNHVCELRSEELYEWRSQQLYTQLLQSSFLRVYWFPSSWIVQGYEFFFFYPLSCATGSSHKSLQRALVTLMVSQPKCTYVLSV